MSLVVVGGNDFFRGEDPDPLDPPFLAPLDPDPLFFYGSGSGSGGTKKSVKI